MAGKPKNGGKVPGAAERIVIDGKITIPEPQLQEPKAAAVIGSQAKKPDPNKPKQVRVGASYLVQALVASGDQTRLSKLRIRARSDRDVRWLLEQYEKLSQPKKNNE
jgi:hypothetical protein